MHGSIMYEVARQRIADQRRAAVKDGEARISRAAARARRARKQETEQVVPAIPDYAHELLAAAAQDTVPAPRQEQGRGRAHAGR
jgi:hypothetical protein